MIRIFTGCVSKNHVFPRRGPYIRSFVFILMFSINIDLSRGRGVRGGGWGGGVGNLWVILVRVCEPVLQNLPHSYTWPLKKRSHSYT